MIVGIKTRCPGATECRACREGVQDRCAFKPTHREPSVARFYDFREMTSRRSSVGCVNGFDHAIDKGDVIGWSRKYHLACCEACWSDWTRENAQADLDEQGGQYH